MVRSHRLWESYLKKHLKLPADHLHVPADHVEHFITDPMREAISRELEEIREDPHGKPIPGREDS